MEARPATCPSADTLRAYGLGKLDDAATETIAQHMETCADCRRQVAQVPADSFVGRFRDAKGQTAVPNPEKALSGVSRGPKEASPASAAQVAGVPPELASHPQYEIVRELGRGGMGVVYLARNRLMDRLEVLKVVSKALLDRPGMAERFLREIRAAAKLSHANVVAAYSALQVGELLVFAMEYVAGNDLAALVKARGPLPIVNACYYAQQAALGLQHAFEKGLVHRDIKPQNLILARDGKKHVVKILDFGLAKANREKGLDRELTGEGQMLGTPDYIAPEQTLDAAKADIRADIYSLGCTLYYLLSGVRPFTGDSLYEILQAHHSVEAHSLNLVRPDVPVELAAVVVKMMAKEPASRFQTPTEVAQALAPFLKPGKPRAVSGPSAELSVGTAEVKADVGKAAWDDRPPTQTAEATKKQPEPAGVWEFLVAGDTTFTGSDNGRAVRKTSPAVGTMALRKKWLIPGGIGVGVLLLAVVGIWAGIIIRAKFSTANGMAFIVLEVDQPDAEVFVDERKITVNVPGDNQPIEIGVAPGRYHLEIKKDGFKAFGQAIELQVAERSKPIKVRLEPLPKDAVPTATGPEQKAGGPADKKAGKGQATQREKRQLRWRLVFNTYNADDYLRQLADLGAILAIPQPKGGYIVIPNEDLLKRPVQLREGDVAALDLIWWTDDKLATVQDLARILGLSFMPECIHAFFPVRLENELLDKELRYPGNKGVEDNIASTVFRVARKEGHYEPVVTEQKLKQR